MDSTPAAKRRKLNNVVNKPFKSPLKISVNQKASPYVSSPLATAPVRDVGDDLARSMHAGSLNASILQETPLKRHSYSSMSHGTVSRSTSSDRATSHEIQCTQRAIRTLESTLVKSRQEIDTLKQALRLATSDKDVELDVLVARWRAAARQAAEEVFADARDRVNRMGGVGAWRERQRETAQLNAWNEPVGKDEETYDDNGDLIKVKSPEREERYEDEWKYDAEIREEEKKDGGRDDDSFSMGMMLKMLNVDLYLIGYDQKEQRWVG